LRLALEVEQQQLELKSAHVCEAAMQQFDDVVEEVVDDDPRVAAIANFKFESVGDDAVKAARRCH
jgi:hypothetical protein